jgi:hypothetical protein
MGDCILTDDEIRAVLKHRGTVAEWQMKVYRAVADAGAAGQVKAMVPFDLASNDAVRFSDRDVAQVVIEKGDLWLDRHIWEGLKKKAGVVGPATAALSPQQGAPK